MHMGELSKLHNKQAAIQLLQIYGCMIVIGNYGEMKMMLKRAENKDITRIEDYYKFVADNTENIPIFNGKGYIFQCLYRMTGRGKGFRQVFYFNHKAPQRIYSRMSSELCLPP